MSLAPPSLWPPNSVFTVFSTGQKTKVSFKSEPNITDEITSKNQENGSTQNNDPVITVESVSTLNQKLIDSENNILEKTEVYDENEIISFER